MSNTPSNTPGAPPRARTPRWRYVVPNAITLIGLLIALTSMFRAFEGHFETAAWLIVLVVLLDKLDGTAARLLNATSDIGVQLDSFADFVSFGIAPGALVFSMMWRDPVTFDLWSGGTAAGWAMRGLVATYILCACVRLAKFNVLSEEVADDSPKVFYGMPTTQAGGIVAATVILSLKYELATFAELLPFALAGLGALMVSNLPLPKIGPRKTKALNVFQGVNVVAGYVCGILRILPEYLFAVLVLYAVIGFGWGVAHRADLKPKRLDPYPT